MTDCTGALAGGVLLGAGIVLATLGCVWFARMWAGWQGD